MMTKHLTTTTTTLTINLTMGLTIDLMVKTQKKVLKAKNLSAMMTLTTMSLTLMKVRSLMTMMILTKVQVTTLTKNLVKSLTSMCYRLQRVAPLTALLRKLPEYLFLWYALNLRISAKP